MVAGVEQPVGDNRVAVSIQNFQLDSIVGIGWSARNDIPYSYGLPEGHAHQCITRDAVPHRRRRVVAR